MCTESLQPERMALIQRQLLSDLEGSGTAAMSQGGERCPGAPWAAPAPGGSLQIPNADIPTKCNLCKAWLEPSDISIIQRSELNGSRFVGGWGFSYCAKADSALSVLQALETWWPLSNMGRLKLKSGKPGAAYEMSCAMSEHRWISSESPQN